MLNKFNFRFVMAMFACVMLTFGATHAATDDFDFDDDVIDVESGVDADVADDVDGAINPTMEDVSANAVAEYDVDGSLFQQITDLEQEKVLMQLEKERAQLDLELDRLAAEKIKLHMEIDTLSGRAEQQAAELETEKAKLEAEAARLAKEKEEIENQVVTPKKPKVIAHYDEDDEADLSGAINDKFKLVNVVGAGTQLQATIADLKTGQNKRVSVGKVIDGYTVKSISLDEGVVFSKDGKTQNLNISNEK